MYSEEFLTDLRGLLTAKKATPATPQAAVAKQPEPQATTASTAPGEFHVTIYDQQIDPAYDNYKILTTSFILLSRHQFSLAGLANAKNWRMTLISNLK